MPLLELALNQSPGDTIVRRALFVLYRKLGLQERAHAFVVEFTSAHGQWKGPMWGEFRKLASSKAPASTPGKAAKSRKPGSDPSGESEQTIPIPCDVARSRKPGSDPK